MATGNILDDVDLINLDNHLTTTFVPLVRIINPTLEEQEHLLGVPSSKFAQKLLCSRQNCDYIPSVNEETTNDNVLIMLTYDQMISILKKIDINCLYTIKRIKDITNNAEPDINIAKSSIIPINCKNCIIHLVFENNWSEKDVSYETKEIIIALNLLLELEHNGDSFEGRIFNDYEQILHTPKLDIPKSSLSSLKRYPITCTESGNCILDNKPSELLLSSNMNKSTNKLTSLKCDSEDYLTERNSFKRLHSFTCSTVGLDFEPLQKKSKNCSNCKSLSNISSVYRLNNLGDIAVTTKQSNNENVEYPQSARNEKHLNIRQPLFCIGDLVSSSSSSGSNMSNCSSLSLSSASSTCSGVDWSWVEEVEIGFRDKLLAASAASPLPSPEMRTGRHRQEDERKRQQQQQQQQQQQPCGSPIGRGGRMRVGELTSLANNDVSFAMSVAAAAVKSATSATVDVATDSAHTDNEHQLQDNAIGCNGDYGPPDFDRISTPRNCERLRSSMHHLHQISLEGNSVGTLTNVLAPNSLPDIALIAPEILAAQTNDTTGSFLRPCSAPAPIRSVEGVNGDSRTISTTLSDLTGATAIEPTNSPRRGRRNGANRCQQRQVRQLAPSSAESMSTCVSSNTTGYMSTVSSTSSVPISPQHQINNSIPPRRLCDTPRDADGEDEVSETDEDENSLGRWPHALSPALACLGCTLGLFNISRFAILSIQFGANFIIQFLILSLIIGIPLLTLQVCLGQRLAAGAVDMWKISPLFQGVGIALLTAQALIGIYSIIGISWMFVYFRDSFITKQDKYRWAEPFTIYRDDIKPTSSSNDETNSNHNNNSNGGPYKLHETVPDYFSGTVLQRHHLNEADPGIVTLKFQVAFNLAVVWMIVFVSLSKGLRSYGKVVYVFTLVPIIGTLILCTKLLGLTPIATIHQLFPATVWAEFFINGRSWITASSEVFLTWGILGSAAMQIAAHNKHKHLLQRDTSLVIVLTFVVLLLAAFLANTCVQILKYHGYAYSTSSFERISGYAFMRPYNQPPLTGYTGTPERFMAHASFLVGQRIIRPGSELNFESGYQALRLSTELVPATFAILGTEQVSPFWAVLFYFTLILFGIAQQLAIWHCVITGIMAINTKMMKLWETTITFFSCVCAYILGLPMATNLGIYVVYYLDYTIGGAWWIMVLYLIQVGAVFAVRGRPHTGETVVAELFPPTGKCLKYWAGPLLSFTWNVIVPITLMVLSITIFKSTGYRELYAYRRSTKDYWAVWARQLGASIQLIPILIIPVVAIIQTCRYLNNGPPDIFDNNQMEVNENHCNQCNGRIQLLYRPSMDFDEQHNSQIPITGAGMTNLHGNGFVSNTTELTFEDPPPKYTPPPSYTTATGARIAKLLRQSFRRSMRRIANVLGESGSTIVTRQRSMLRHQPPPPDYAAVLVEMNQRVPSHDITVHVPETRPEAAARLNLNDRRLGHFRTINHSGARFEPAMVSRAHHSLDRRHYSSTAGNTSTLTAVEVANLLRSSFRCGSTRNHQREVSHLVIGNEPQQSDVSRENLVEAAAPISQDSLLVHGTEQVLMPSNLNKTALEMEGSISVI